MLPVTIMWSLKVGSAKLFIRIIRHLSSCRLLSAKQRIDFKLAVLVYKSLHDLAPPYLSDDCQLVTDVVHVRRHLRSSDVYTCVVPREQSQIGDRSFSVAGPRLWNNLPTEIRKRDITFEHYRRLIRRFCSFRLWRIIVTYLSAPDISTFTQSLTH